MNIQSKALRWDPTLESYESCPWSDIFPGDVIQLVENEPVPADMLITSSSNADTNHGVQVETSNLDGESNLKCFCALPAAAKIMTESPKVGLYSQDGSCLSFPPSIDQPFLLS